MSDIDTAAKFLYMGNQNGPLSKLNGYESGSFNVGKGIPVDPAFGCPKNFVSSYMCGNAVKNINIEGEAVGKRAKIWLRAKFRLCFMVIRLSPERANLCMVRPA